MTWPDGIAAALGITTAILLEINQHQQRSTTQPHHHSRTEPHHGQDQQPPQDHRPQPGEEDNREEDHRRPGAP